jgi:hypothetical protein
MTTTPRTPSDPSTSRLETYEEIWEKDAKWLSGREILGGVVNELKGKAIKVYIDENDTSIFRATLPLATISLAGKRNQFIALYAVPEELEEIFKDRLQMIMNDQYPLLHEVASMFEGQRLDPSTIACVNEELQRRERLAAYENKPTLADHAAKYFGLVGWHALNATKESSIEAL